MYLAGNFPDLWLVNKLDAKNYSLEHKI